MQVARILRAHLSAFSRFSCLATLEKKSLQFLQQIGLCCLFSDEFFVSPAHFSEERVCVCVREREGIHFESESVLFFLFLSALENQAFFRADRSSNNTTPALKSRTLIKRSKWLLLLLLGWNRPTVLLLLVSGVDIFHFSLES